MKKICETTAETLPSVDEILNKADDVCPVQWTAKVARLAHDNVCGHGTFCRDGMFQLYLIPEDIIKGRGVVEDLDVLKDCCDLIITANECELSVKTAELVKASLENHYDDWYDHITRKRCKAMQCPSCYTLYIDPATCDGCGKCVANAPDGVIAGGEGMIHVVKKDDNSIKTPEFLACCPKAAIKKAGAVKPPVPTDPVPVGSFGAGAAGGRRRG
jgi:NADH-quinone oxidoreductase subunit F